MGCSLLCVYFKVFSSFLECVVRDVSGCSSVVHYLDDFFVYQPGGRNRVFIVVANMVEKIPVDFGVPLVPEKTEGTAISFLGITIDTVKMECCLPEYKVWDLRAVVGRVSG